MRDVVRALLRRGLGGISDELRTASPSSLAEMEAEMEKPPEQQGQAEECALRTSPFSAETHGRNGHCPPRPGQTHTSHSYGPRGVRDGKGPISPAFPNSYY